MWPGDEIVLRDGTRMPVRTLRSDDAGRVQRLFDGLSERSRYQRFLQPMAHLPAPLLERFTRVAPPEELALACLSGDDFVAVGRYAPYDERSAEFLVVADAILNANVGMLDLAARLGFVPHSRSGGEITVVRRL